MKETVKHRGNSRDDNHVKQRHEQVRALQTPQSLQTPDPKRKKANTLEDAKRQTPNDISRRPTAKKPPVASISSAQQNDIFFASQHRGRLLPVKRPSRKNLCLPKRPPSSSSADATEGLENKKQKVNSLEIMNEIDKDEDLDTSKKRGSETVCPYCKEELVGKLPDILQKTLAEIQKKDEQFEQAHGRKKSQNLHLRLKRKATRAERDHFCRLHYIELKIKPQGHAKQYPANIDFNLVTTRVHRLKSELDDILSGKVLSTFREKALGAYGGLGTHKARKSMGGISGFQKALPGYYGSKGAEVILDALTGIYIRTGILTIEKTHPQLPVEYAQQILVPEVGHRLIMDDLLQNRNKDYSTEANMIALKKQALEIMKESTEYGQLIYPADEDIGDVKTADGDSDEEASSVGSNRSALSDDDG